MHLREVIHHRHQGGDGHVVQLLKAIGLAALLGICNIAAAQGYPGKQLRLVVPFPPGGPVDVTGRLIAQKLGDSSGQTVIVDNRIGAGTIIGTELVVKSAPDGHTLLIVPTQIAINPSMYAKLPYDTLTDLAAVTQMTYQPFLLIVNPAVPAKTVRELIALAKAKPGALNCASSGIGGANHLACELFNTMAGTKITHVPYKGAAPAITDLIGGQIQVYFPNPITAIQHINSGKLRALAITGKQRASMLPDLPTVAESGVPGYEAGTWFGVFAAGTTPRDIVRRVQQEFARVLQLPDVRQNLTAEGGEIIASTPEQFATYLKAEIIKWGEVVKFSGAKAE